MHFRAALRSSASWYLSALAIGIVTAAWSNYLWYEIPIFKGQSAAILTMFVTFGLSFVLWLALKPRARATGALAWFLALLTLAWLAHVFLYRFHGDAFNYTALLYAPILFMFWWKPPSGAETWLAINGFAWGVSVVLVITRVLEMTQTIPIKNQLQGLIDFDQERYFLPLNDLMGIDGRWPGPFGHNADTAMMGALLIVIAFAAWSRASWVFLIVGSIVLVLTNGRASIGAAGAGLIVMFVFTRTGVIARIRPSIRIGLGSCLLVLGAVAMFARPSGLTGRQAIWPAFLELWWQSPWVGVGGIGIAQGNEIAQRYGHAHSLYIDELARWGLVGFVTQFAALGLGLFIAARAAGLGHAGPLAVMVAYFITGITEPRNNWIAPSATGFLMILMVLAGAGYLRRRDPYSPSPNLTSPEPPERQPQPPFRATWEEFELRRIPPV